MPQEDGGGELIAIGYQLFASPRCGRLDLKYPALQAIEGELGGFGDCHDGHDACLHRVADDEVRGIGDAAGHIQADHQETLGTDFADRDDDIAAHERPGQDEGADARETGDGTDSAG